MGVERPSKDEVRRLTNIFKRLDIEEEEFPNKHFFIGILDRFNYCLSETEASELLSSFEYDMLFEESYLSFFNKIYSLNNYQTFIFCPYLKSLSENEIKVIRENFKRDDLLLFEKLLSLETDLYEVRNVSYLRLFVKLSTRSLCFSNFFFPITESLIIGNYDLAFPVYSRKENTLYSYEKVANDYGLYIRRS
ncbi:hypothetical protein IHV12_19965 [Fictibacillus sp. 7GRE50]|uniref:hypothetical protein n=2 Tax=Bacillales TaxID=1385 RepID=UPI0018CCC715|nr:MULTISPECIES: hypothetical protein [unclassified Fictibacillus]MBH0167204.1 hypothetical protein [Fictibacillus sp. 7GRE50]MBH0171510.1 hypothetical protein [Fictibacillus sp. 18YEL24]